MRKTLGLLLFTGLLPLFLFAQPLIGADKSRFDYANELFSSGKYEQTVEYCTEMINRSIRNDAVYRLRAMAYRAIGRYEDAVLSYTEAIQLNSREPQLYLDRAQMHTCLRQFDKAEMDINEAIRLSREQRPGSAKDHYFLLEEKGRVAHYLGYYRNAVTDLKMAAENGSNMAQIDLLSAFLRNANFEDLRHHSTSLLQNVAAGDPGLLSDSSLFYYTSALSDVATLRPTLFTLNRIDGALTHYRKRDGCFPGYYYDLLYAKAYVQSALGHDTAAYDIYKQLYAANNRQADVKQKLNDLKLKLGLDATAPLVVLKNPQTDENNTASMATANGSVEIYGQVTDSSGIEAVYVNKQRVTQIESDGLFITNLTLRDGRNEVVIEAVDKNDNLTEKRFIINLIAPTAQAADDTAGIPELFSHASYHAILIGENDYQDAGFADLENPVKDVNELKDILVKNYQFNEKNVTVLTNAPRLNLLDTIRVKCENLTEEDNLLIFYAGHGQVRRMGSNIVDGYLVPTDAKKGSWNTYVSSEDLKSSIKYSLAKHILFLMDACFAGALFRSLDDAPPNIKDQYSYKSRRFLSSGNLEEVPDKGKFIQNIKMFLKNNTQKYVSANQLYAFIQNNTDNNTPRYDRIPNSDDNGGHFIFIRR